MDIFEIVAEPHRRTVLDLLADADRSAGELVAGLPALSQPAVSRHLRVLREAGLVRVEPKGQQRIYSLAPEPLSELDQWLERYRRFWTARLDALEARLAEVHPPSRPPSPRKPRP